MMAAVQLRTKSSDIASIKILSGHLFAFRRKHHVTKPLAQVLWTLRSYERRGVEGRQCLFKCGRINKSLQSFSQFGT